MKDLGTCNWAQASQLYQVARSVNADHTCGQAGEFPMVLWVAQQSSGCSTLYISQWVCLSFLFINFALD